MKLRGKVALVTGGAKRIGKTIALQLAQAGAHVAITYRSSESEAKTTCRLIQQKKVRALALAVDQRDPHQVRTAVNEVVSHFGRLDILVNNASHFYPTPLEEVTPAQWDDLIQTNLTGPWYFAQAAAGIMRRQKQGKMVNMVDVAGFDPWPDYLPYCAAKGGLITLTRGLAKALAPHVQVNAIAPGPILFPPGMGRQEKEKAIAKTLLKRCGSPEDIAQAVLFFVGSTDYVTGVVLPVDGGRLLA